MYSLRRSCSGSATGNVEISILALGGNSNRSAALRRAYGRPKRRRPCCENHGSDAPLDGGAKCGSGENVLTPTPFAGDGKMAC